MKPRLFTSALVLAAASLALTVGAKEAPAPAKRGNWVATVAPNEGGHVLGNPAAKVKLIEFMSYTCSHCEVFAREGDGVLKMVYVPTGKVSYEIRHLVRDPIDLTATLLTHCGEPKKFTLNHQAMMAAQPIWMEKARRTTQAQQSRWQFGTAAARFQAIASDLDFYDVMEARGYTRPQLDACLADEAQASAIATQSRADVTRYGLQGTPSFVLDGTLLDGTHNWTALRPLLDAAL